MTLISLRPNALRGLACAALLACSAPVLWAQTPSAAATPLAQGGGIAVTTADIEADAHMRMPPEMQSMVLSNAKTVGQIASNMYVRRALAQQAAKLGLDKDAQIADQLQLARDKVMSDAMLARIDAQHAPSDKAALDQARSVYQAKPERFQVGEQVQARHILIAGTTPESKAQAEKLLAELKGGADFAKLAQEHSADKGSAAKGGELGLFGKGRMVPEFEQAAFALKNKGDLSDLVKTQFGYHIIQLEAHKPAHTRAFDEVKDELVKEVRANITQDARVAEAQKIAGSMKLDEKAVDAFAEQHKAPSAKK